MWKNLEHPPVVVALLQLKYSATQFKLEDFLKYESLLKKNFPIKRDNLQGSINLDASSIPIGISKISATSNVKIGGYLFATTDQKRRIEITADTITYIDENTYKGWNDFKKDALEIMEILLPTMQAAEITRTSIRFVNRIMLPDFDNPEEYVNTVITSTNPDPFYPLRQYGFRLLMDVPDTDIYSIVNHNVELLQQDNYLYTLDIDVLDRQCLIFNLETISDNMEALREIKNTIFFNTLSAKTINLCNLQN